MLKPAHEDPSQVSIAAHFCVYIAECADGTLYTGITTDVERRLREHNAGKAGARYTRGRRPVRLVHMELADTRADALKREAEIKGLGRAQKLSLIQHGPPKPSDAT